MVHCNNGSKGVKAKSNKLKGKSKGIEVDNGKKGPEVDNNKPNYIKGGRVPPKNLPRNTLSQSFEQEKELSEYPDFEKFDRSSISPEMVDLMNIYNKLRDKKKGDILFEHLQLLLAMSTHMRNRDSKFSRAHNGKIMTDWDCFNRIQDKVWH
jgi:hypothetical protein